MSAHVVIVGGGIMGLSTAWAATRRGLRVTLLEQARIPNPLGSSFDRHRLIRYPYGAFDGYARMVLDAYDAWRALWADLGETLYVESGTLVLSGSEGGWAKDSVRNLEALKLPHSRITPAEMTRRWPHLKPDGLSFVLHLAGGGVLLADRIVAALAAHLRSRIDLREDTRVTEIDPTRASVRLADRTTIAGDHLVLAAGPWTARLVPALADRIVPSRQILAYAAPPAAHAAHWPQSPMVLENTDNVGFYAVPPVAGTPLKIGDHHFTRHGDPDRDREPNANELSAVLALSRQRLVDGAGYALAGGRTCFYTVTEDERFVAHTEGPTLALSPCSGHGFKFGPVIGQRVAATLAGEQPVAVLARWLAGH
jgi:glycine/D-amino acid oxidase-like deaminating enzyme